MGLRAAKTRYTNPRRVPIKEQTLPRGRALASGEIPTLMGACGRDSSPAGIRDAALIVLYGAGLRRSESVGLDLADYNIETGELAIRGAKGRKDRLGYATNGSADALKDWLVAVSHSPHHRDWTLGNTAGALRDPVLQQSGQAGHDQESQSRPDPAEITPAARIRDDSADHGDAGPHWSDDVANPVNEVQERAFRLRPGLTLDRNVDLRRCAKVLSESHGLAHYQKADCQYHGCYTNVLHLRVNLHRDSAPYRRRAPLESLTGAGPTNSGLVRMLGQVLQSSKKRIEVHAGGC